MRRQRAAWAVALLLFLGPVACSPGAIVPEVAVVQGASAVPAPSPEPEIPQSVPAAPAALPPSSEQRNAEIEARRILPRIVGAAGISRRPPVQRLVIPRVAIDTRVVELGFRSDERGELVWATAAFAAGHHRGTAQPGDGGNIVISGHISSRNEGAVFRRLPDVAVGDGVILSTADKDYLYRVTSTEVVEPGAVHVMEPTAAEQVTLITCVPDGIFSHRLVVVATPVS